MFELHRQEPGHVGLGHGRAVDVVGHFHRLVVVGDEDELGLVLDRLQEVEEAGQVDVVEGRVDLVQEAEGRRPVAEEGEQEGQAGQRFLAAREQDEVLDALARRLGDDLDAALEGIVRLEELDLGVAALEERGEEVSEVLVDLLQGLEELVLALLVDLADGLDGRGDGVAEVLALLGQEVEALLLFDELLFGHQVDGLEAVERLARFLELLLDVVVRHLGEGPPFLGRPPGLGGLAAVPAAPAASAGRLFARAVLLGFFLGLLLGFGLLRGGAGAAVPASPRGLPPGARPGSS